MNFSRLPDIAFLKILEYLPLDECIRVGRVDKLFRRMAKLATSYTKWLDLREGRFRKLTPAKLAVILDLCSSNLERIKFGGGFFLGDHYQQLASIFAREWPRLTDIYLDSTPIDQAIFEQLIGNCPNMESLVWFKEFVGYPAITSNNLKKLSLNIRSDASLRTLIGRCPNLEEIFLWSKNVHADVLDQFFASVPRLQRIDIDSLSVNSIEVETKLVNFWNLPLIYLEISFDNKPEDDFLLKVATSFPHLRELRLGQLKPTNRGIASLADLQELQVLHLKLHGFGSNEYDQGIRQLAHCGKLRNLDVSQAQISGGTLINLLRSCPQLGYVKFWDIGQVESPEEAVIILKSLAGISARDITVSFHSKESMSIWEGEAVKAAIKKLEDDEGLKIKIEDH